MTYGEIGYGEAEYGATAATTEEVVPARVLRVVGASAGSAPDYEETFANTTDAATLDNIWATQGPFDAILAVYGANVPWVEQKFTEGVPVIVDGWSANTYGFGGSASSSVQQTIHVLEHATTAGFAGPLTVTTGSYIYSLGSWVGTRIAEPASGSAAASVALIEAGDTLTDATTAQARAVMWGPYESLSADAQTLMRQLVTDWLLAPPAAQQIPLGQASEVEAAEPLAVVQSAPASAYETAVLADAPLVYWRLNEASGTAAVDSSGNGRSAAWGGTPTLGTSGLLAESDLAVGLDNGDYAYIVSASWMDTPHLTAEAWVKPTVLAGDQAIVSRTSWFRASGDSTRGWHLAIIGNQFNVGLRFTDGAFHDAKVGPVLTVGVTYHAVLTWDGTTARLYLNGQEAWSSTAFSGKTLHAPIQDLVISGESHYKAGLNSAVKGTLDEVAVYDTALSVERIREHYRAGAIPSTGYAAEVATDTPLAYYRMGSLSGTGTLIDATGNGRHGNLAANVTVTPGLLVDDADPANAFPGSGAQGSVLYGAWMSSDSFTVEAIVHPTNTNKRGIADRHAYQTLTFQFRLEADGKLNFILETGGVIRQLITTAALMVNQTYHVAASWDAATNTATIYVDGAVAATAVYAGALRVTNSHLSVGHLVAGTSGAGGVWPFIGTIDEVAYYGTALSPTRIAAHYDASRGVATTPPPPQTVALVQAVEMEAAEPLLAVQSAPAQTIPLGQVSEVETAQSLTVLATPYRDAVLADAPLVYWRFDEPSGTVVADASGNGRDGTVLTGATPGAPGLVPAESGSAIDVAGGTNAGVSRDHEAWMHVTAAISVEGWFYLDGTPGSTGAHTLAAKDNTSANFTNRAWKLDVADSTGVVTWSAFVTSSTRFTVNSPTGAVPRDTAVHIVGTYDGVTARLYINGAEVASQALSGSLRTSTYALRVGTDSSGTARSLNGRADEFALYDHALTPQRVQAHYDLGMGITVEPAQQIPLGQVVETETAEVLTVSQAAPAQEIALGQASEVETAQPLGVLNPAAPTGPPRVLLVSNDLTNVAHNRAKIALESQGVVVTSHSDSTLDSAPPNLSVIDVIVTVRVDRDSVRSWLSARWAEGFPILVGGAEIGVGGGTTAHTGADLGLLTSPVTGEASNSYGSPSMTNLAAHPITAAHVAGSNVNVTYAAATWSVRDTGAGVPDRLGSIAGSVPGHYMTAVEVGTALISGRPNVPGPTAPARAVFCGWVYAAQSDYTPEGAALLGKAVEWLTEEPGSATPASQTVPLGQASEAEAAQPLALSQTTPPPTPLTLPLATVVETETAQPLTRGGAAQVIPLGMVVETETAHALTVSLVVSATLEFGATGELVLDEDIAFDPVYALTILDDSLYRAPTSLTYMMTGLPAGESVSVYFNSDTTAAWTSEANSEGQIGPLAINVETDIGAGSHMLRARIDGVEVASAPFTMQRGPVVYPTNVGSDAQPLLIPGAVSHDTRHWVFQDLLAVELGGIGSFVLPINPREMSSPHQEYGMSGRHTTAITGQHHVFQTGEIPKEWTFSGYCPDEETQHRMEAYRHLNRRFYIIDHHNRAWKCVITHMEFVPRLRHVFNGVETDWGSDYTVTATVLDQDPRTPA